MLRRHPFAIKGSSSTYKSQAEEAEKVPLWWKNPKDLSPRELGLLRWFSSITDRLPEEEIDQVWAMRGGKPVGPDQLGFTSIRYHLAFTGHYRRDLTRTQP